MNTADQLHDIQGLAPVSWWPLAPGWWLLFALILILLLFLGLFKYYRQAKKFDWRQPARQQLAHLSQLSPREQVIQLATLLRRIAIERYGRLSCAGLSGQAWLAWLTEHDPSGFDWQQHGRLLIEGPYRPPDDPMEEYPIQHLVQAVEAWIEP